jgi:hypothetical protein
MDLADDLCPLSNDCGCDDGWAVLNAAPGGGGTCYFDVLVNLNGTTVNTMAGVDPCVNNVLNIIWT